MQQQTVVTSAGPVHPVYLGQPYQTSSVISSYRSRQSTLIGALLIVAGSLSIIFSVIEIVIVTTSLTYYSVALMGDGIWCGVLVIIAGGFGVGAGRHRSRCMINAFLVLAIIGAIFAAGQTLRGSVNAYIASNDNYVAYDLQWVMQTVLAMSVIVAILGACEFALCLWGSILCCATGGCCCAPQPVAFTMMPAGGEPVAMAQHPADQPPVHVYLTPPQYPGYDQK